MGKTSSPLSIEVDKKNRNKVYRKVKKKGFDEKSIITKETTGNRTTYREKPSTGTAAKKAVSGTLKAAGSAITKATGAALDALEPAKKIDKAASSDHRRAIQEHKNAAHYREMLRRGTLDDGTQLTAKQRKQSAINARQSEKRSQNYETANENKHQAITQVSSRVKNVSKRLANESKADLKTAGKSTVAKTISGAVKQSAGATANAAGTLLEGVKHFDMAGSSERRRAAQERENAAHYREMVRRGTLDDGTRLSDEQRRQFIVNAKRAEQRSQTDQASNETKHQPITQAISRTQKKADQLTRSGQQDTEAAKTGLGKVGRFAVDAGTAGTQMAVDAAVGLALSPLTGGTSLLAPMAVRSFGGGAQEARQAGKSFGQQLAYGAGSAALAAGTEKMFNNNFLDKKFGGSLLDKAMDKGLSKIGLESAARSIPGRIVKGALEESLEEAAESIGQDTALKPLTLGDLVAFHGRDTAYQAAIGATLGALGGLGGGVRNRLHPQNSQTQDGTQPVETNPTGPAQSAQLPQAPQTQTDAPVSPKAFADAVQQVNRQQTQNPAQSPTQILLLPEHTTQPVQQAGKLQFMGPPALDLKSDLPLDPTVKAVLDGQKRANIDWGKIPDRQTDLIFHANDSGLIDMDAENKLFRVDPEQHIDQRSSSAIGNKKLNAFQFDHPQLQRFYKQAAQCLISDLYDTQRGGEIRQYASKDLYTGIGYARSKRITSQPIASLRDDYGMTYPRIEKALNAILNDGGQENYADAKRIELVLDDILSNGYTAIDGSGVLPSFSYRVAKSDILGSQESPSDEIRELAKCNCPFGLSEQEIDEMLTRGYIDDAEESARMQRFLSLLRGEPISENAAQELRQPNDFLTQEIPPLSQPEYRTETQPQTETQIPLEIPSLQSQSDAGSDGLGAANAFSLDNGFSHIQAQTPETAFHPINSDSAQRMIDDYQRAPAEIPKQNPETARNISKTVSTILNSPLTSNEMAPILENAVAVGRFDYDKITDRSALAEAESSLQNNGYRDAAQEFVVKTDLGQRVSKKDVTTAIAAYNQAVAAKDHVTAFELADAIAASARESAQVVQAMNLFNRMSPEGKLVSLRRLVDRMNSRSSKKTNSQKSRKTILLHTDSEAVHSDFVEKHDGILVNSDLATDYLMAETDVDRAAAWDAILNDIASQVPNTISDKWNAWRYLSMLANPTTHIRNSVGNLVFGQLVRRAKNALGAVGEKIFIRDKTQRSKTGLFTLDRELIQFAKGQYDADQQLAMGEGKYSDNSGISREIQERRKILDGPFDALSNLNTRLLDKEDFIFNRSAYVDSLAQALKAKGVTAEEAASGQKAELVENARAYAIQEAQKATFRDSNTFSNFISNLGKAHDDSGLQKIKETAVDAILPFRRTPADVLVRGIEYSPIGLVKAITYDAAQVKNGNMTSTDMMDHISSGLTGTGIVALGAYLAAQGLLTLRMGGSDSDQDEQTFLSEAGFQDFALNIGGHSYTLGWMAPAAIPLFAGAAMMESFQENGVNFDSFLKGLDSSAEGIKSITDVILETSMLSSMEDLLDGIGYSESKPWYLLSKTLFSYLSQGIPTVLNKTASVFDDTVRRSYVPGDTPEYRKDLSYFAQNNLLKKIPIARNQMQPKIDLWGNPVSNGEPIDRSIQAFLSPGFSKSFTDDALTDELTRLSDSLGTSAVYPKTVGKSFKVDGDMKYLGAEEYTEYARTTGQTRRDILDRLLSSSGYQKLQDDEKANAIKLAYEYADAQGKMAVSAWKPADSSAVKKMLENPIIPPADYILYNQFQNRVSDEQSKQDANASVREAIFNDSALSVEQKNALDDALINDIRIIPEDKDVDYSDYETYKITQMTDSARKHWPLLRDGFGLDPDTYQQVWSICQNNKLKAAQKRQKLYDMGLDGHGIFKACHKEID